MTNPPASLLGPVLLLALPLSAALPAQRKSALSDTIVKTTGQKLRNVEVISDHFDKVTFKRGSTEQTLSGAEVETIEWHEPSEALRRAQAAVEKKAFAEAANYYAEAANGAEREPVKAHAKFRAAWAALRAAGNEPAANQQAASQLQAFATEFAQSRYTPEASLLLARALAQAGQVDEAVAACKKVEDAALNQNWGPRWDARAKYERAHALMAAAKYDEAGFAFQAAATTVGAMTGDIEPEMRALAVSAAVGQGECKVAAKQYADANSYFKQLAASAGQDMSLYAAALCGQAEAGYHEALANKDMTRLRAAQLLCAEVVAKDILNGDSTAKAMYLHGKILLALGDEEGGDPAVRARAFFELVRTHFPASRWAREAQAELKPQ